MLMMDSIDTRILAALQRDGRLTNVELAQEVGLSPSPCLRRVKLLEDAGIIQRYVALLDPAKVGLGFTVFVRVWLKGQDQGTVEHFIREIAALDQVVEAHLMAGDCDYLLRVVAEDLQAYRRFQAEKLGNISCIQSLKTDIPMQTTKQTWQLPVRAR